MEALARMLYRKSVVIKKISCCGCYFDKICYLVNTKKIIDYEFFESSLPADWFFQDFNCGVIVVVCDQILNFLLEQNSTDKFNFKDDSCLYQFHLDQ